MPQKIISSLKYNLSSQSEGFFPLLWKFTDYTLDSAHLGTLSKFSSVCVMGLYARSGSRFNFDQVCGKELLYRNGLDRQGLLQSFCFSTVGPLYRIIRAFHLTNSQGDGTLALPLAFLALSEERWFVVLFFCFFFKSFWSFVPMF